MAKYAVHYAYTVDYTAYVEADSEQEALEKHYAQDYIQSPKENEWKLQQETDIELQDEELN